MEDKILIALVVIFFLSDSMSFTITYCTYHVFGGERTYFTLISSLFCHNLICCHCDVVCTVFSLLRPAGLISKFILTLGYYKWIGSYFTTMGHFFSFFIAENSGSISETGLIIARVLMAKIRYVRQAFYLLTLPWVIRDKTDLG